MTSDFEFKNLKDEVVKLSDDIHTLQFQDQILEEKIEGRLKIAEHTNIFLDVVFILLSVVLWVITMQGWRNSKDVEKERSQLRELLEQDREEVKLYKKSLEEDRQKFEIEYYKTIEETLLKINENKNKVEDGYRVIQEQYEEIVSKLQGASEYYLELVSISHEPDLGERVFEYERILKNSEKYNLSKEEKGRLNYYLSITLYQLVTKSPEARNKIVTDWIKKASKCIANAISLGGESGTYFYEKAKIELEKYRLYLISSQDFTKLSEKIYEIEEYFDIAFKKSDVEFYMFEEMVLLLKEFVEKLTTKPSDKRIILDIISVWCDRAKAFDEPSYKEDLEYIKKQISLQIEEQNKKLNE